MPPKKDQKAGSSSKVAIDKTFGMKNKKGGKGQKVVARLQHEATTSGKSPAQIAKEKEMELRRKEKENIEKRAREDAALIAQPVQKVPFGVDPKTVYCVYHKAGFCQKGNKCKFSHDPNVGRKVEKRDIYADSKEDKLKDTMDQWDEEKLRTVVNSKGNPRTTTDIVCKFFIEAIETEKFGWFWTCPNDEKEKNGCMYRHALPPGFVLKSQRKALEAAARADTISLEDFIEVERHKLPKTLTPVTAESFAKWKQTRQDKKLAEEQAMQAAKDAKAAAGKSSGMSGRDLFSYNPEWFAQEDDEEGDDDFDWATYRKEQQEN
ncbi:hypothetical protein DL93DRAFT_2040775, partial [Clavulina sp. PMI_390]